MRRELWVVETSPNGESKWRPVVGEAWERKSSAIREKTKWKIEYPQLTFRVVRDIPAE